MSLDGVIDAPTWIGRTTYEMFEPAWSVRTAEEDPGAPFFNDTTKYVVSGALNGVTYLAYRPENS